MKITFPTLFKTDIHKYKFFFIYGNDLVVFERIICFLNKKFSCPIEIKSEKEFLTSSGEQPSLFETHPALSLILVSNVSDKIITHLDQIREGIYIFTSEKARAQSKLVTYFGGNLHSLAIAAYVSPLVPAEFEFLTGDLTLPNPFKGLLFKTYQNDYMGLLATLEKIRLYGDVPESAYRSFLESSSTSDDFQSLIQPFLLKQSKGVSEVLSTIPSTDMIPLFRALLRSFQSLYELIPFKKSPGAVPWQSLKSPVFFKDQPLYQSALSQWNPEEVLHFLESLLALEYKVKYEGMTFSQVGQELIKRVGA